MTTFLTDIDSDEVSLVQRGANRRRFSFMKSREETRELQDMLSVPHPNEGAVLDELRKEGFDESVEEAVLAYMRLEKELPEDVVKAMRSQIKRVPAQGKPADAGSADGDDTDAHETSDEDLEGEDDGDVVKRNFDRGVGGGVDRDKLPAGDFAGPNRSFPIVNQSDVSDALRLSGKAANPSAVRQRIAAIARRKGLKVPDSVSKESVEGDIDNKGGHGMSEGTAVAVPIRKEDGSWDLSNVPEDARGFYQTVLKAQDDLKAENESLRGEVKKAQDEAAEASDKLRDSEFVSKAAGFEHIAKADELGPVLKEIAGAVSEETYGKLEEILKAAEERIATGDLFGESRYVVTDSTTGKVVKEATSSEGDAWSKIEKLASELVEKSTDLSQAQAIDRVLKTDEGKQLYADYTAELAGRR